MRRMVADACLLLATATFSTAAVAEPSPALLVRRLKSGEDFRVRTQAALALGASKDKKAVKPLCAALSDDSRSVRIAAAAALGRLSLGGEDCLKARLATERSPEVLASIRKAVQALSPKEPKSSIDSSTKYYVAIGEAMNHTGRSDKQLDPVVRSAMQRAAARLRIFAVAPAGETARAAKQVMGSHKTLKAYFLLPKVLDPKYQSGDLRVAIEVTMFTYPTRALLGTYSLSLTQRSVPSKDPSAEAELVQMAAETAMEKFAGHVQSLP